MMSRFLEQRYLKIKVGNIKYTVEGCEQWVKDEDHNRLVEYLQDVEDGARKLRETLEGEL